MLPDHLQHVALDILELDHVDWMHINTLTVSRFYPACEHYAIPVVIDDSVKDKAEHALQFFAQNLRNVLKLDMPEGFSVPIRDFIREELAHMYGGQVQILRATGPLSHPFSELSRTISVLELSLDNEAAQKLPNVCGETLRELKLSKVPQNFAWRRFRYDIFVRPIVFPRLTILHLNYDGLDAELTEDEIQSRVSSGARNCDQLCFPALKELSIYNCSPDCDLLYADTPFPELEKVTLLGSFDSIRHCSRLKLVWVGDLNVRFWTQLDNFTTDVHNVTNALFTNICIGRSAVLDLDAPQLVIDPEAIRWVNLTALSVYTVSYRTLCKLIARLPNLATFKIYSLEFDDMQVGDFYMDESLFCGMDPLLAWGERLVNIRIISLNEVSSLAVRVGGIQALVLQARGLVELGVPSDLVPVIKTFIGINKRQFAHLANIDVLEEAW
ncbi:hypothetical protein IWW38_003266 [Coemansia aciculifera]|uniref:Uncharacterized protein n=1 Tax=Coemansia aciculifera TaxID=417176 RepID=A0ACC1M181_9FUNG|nr:hypothetical protein IWW38_003266 [Coemansia aciculifera]